MTKQQEKDWESGWWAKGLHLSGSQVDYLKSIMNGIRTQAKQEGREEVLKMFKEEKEKMEQGFSYKKGRK